MAIRCVSTTSRAPCRLVQCNAWSVAYWAAFRMALILASASFAASAIEDWPVRTLVSMVLIGLLASTPAQRGSFGVNPLPAAASVA